MRLPTRLRLKQSRDFTRIREKGRSQAGRFLVLASLPDTTVAEFHFGLITGKKVGPAVTRNGVRRRLREIIRKHRASIQSQVIFTTIARWRAAEATLAELEKDWLRLAKQLGLLRPAGSIPATTGTAPAATSL
jgi:ribonuclease P protein component